jgi:hypothetical protein
MFGNGRIGHIGWSGALCRVRIYAIGAAAIIAILRLEGKYAPRLQTVQPAWQSIDSVCLPARRHFFTGMALRGPVVRILPGLLYIGPDPSEAGCRLPSLVPLLASTIPPPSAAIPALLSYPCPSESLWFPQAQRGLSPAPLAISLLPDGFQEASTLLSVTRSDAPTPGASSSPAREIARALVAWLSLSATPQKANSTVA